MSDPEPLTEHLFRQKHGEILAALLRYAGYEQFELAEEAVQLAFQRALERWPFTGAPDNPGGWLYSVARNILLEAIRRKKFENISLEQLQRDPAADDPSPATPDGPDSPAVLDDLATMILLCCNPELSPKAQVCLTLKSACGFSVKEIARALGMQDEAIKKTITRAKEVVASERTAFEALDGARISARFGLVMETLYAMFNEGYAASSGDSQLRRDIAEEAIRLADIFLRTPVTPEQRKGELHALIALMLFQFARFDARTDEAGVPVRLQEQDRAKWNRDMIQAGFVALQASRSSEHLTAFHLEARIAAAHATSPSFDATNWATILTLYDQLLLNKDTPEVRLSRIVALRYVRGWEAAFHELDRLEPAATTVTRSFLLHAIRADLLESAGRPSEAITEWKAAWENAPTKADRAFVETKLKKLP